MKAYFLDSENIRVLHIEFDRTQELFRVLTIDEWKDVFETALIHPDTLVQKENGKDQFIVEDLNTLYTSNAYFSGTFEKLAPATKPLTAFMGLYESEEVAHQVTLSIENGRLSAPNTYFKKLTLVSDDLLVDEGTGAILTFKRDGKGQISSFTIDIKNGDRMARNIVFKKIEGN